MGPFICKYDDVVQVGKKKHRGLDTDAHNIVMVSNGVVRIKGQAGQFISLLPLGEDVHITSTQGLKYPIIDKWLP